MSISSDQATEAVIFLDIYKEAIAAIQESAIKDTANEVLENFTDKMLQISQNRIFKKICNPRDPQITYQGSKRFREIVRDVRVFQFSHYAFLKYMPNFLAHPGNSKELIQYMKTQNNSLQKELSS